MANEEEKNETLTGAESGDEIRTTPEYTGEDAEQLPEPETGVEEVVADVIEATEEAAETPFVEAYDEAVKSAMQAVEDLTDHDDAHLHDAHLSDTVSIMGREITLPGGIYTLVFIVLGVVTLIEILLAEMPSGFLTIPLMLSLAMVKVILVVVYYMHLKEDSRIFTVTLVLPALVMLIATLYLLAVPTTGY